MDRVNLLNMAISPRLVCVFTAFVIHLEEGHVLRGEDLQSLPFDSMILS